MHGSVLVLLNSHLSPSPIPLLKPLLVFLLSLEMIRLVSVMCFTALGRSSPKSSVVIKIAVAWWSLGLRAPPRLKLYVGIGHRYNTIYELVNCLILSWHIWLAYQVIYNLDLCRWAANKGCFSPSGNWDLWYARVSERLFQIAKATWFQPAFHTFLGLRYRSLISFIWLIFHFIS